MILQRVFCSLVALGTFVSFAGSLPSALAEPTIEHGVVVLQGLDKVTARTQVIDLAIGDTLEFGTLQITVRTCLETPPTEPPESVAFLEIDAVDPGRDPENVYTGWMFASSPGLAALEHPVYDIWVLDCKDAFPETNSG